jgi:L-lysine exporter family protein LysE/ArgO
VSPLLFGMLFGLATAFPIGVQSFVVMNQGLRVGYPRVLVGIATASLCDTLLIVVGAAGASALLVAPGNERLLISIGVLFFTVIGVMALCSPPEEETEVKSRTRVGAMIVQTVGVSLLNPHAVFETIGLLGGAIAVQSAGDRLGFAAGVISASWAWFFAIGFGASALRARLTPPVKLWTQRGSGALMLVFAAFLALQLI